MKRQMSFFLLMSSLVFVMCTGKTEPVQSDVEEITESAIQELKLTNLLRDSLALADNVEIIISHVEIPANAKLEAHYHPGEEFVYMISGSGELTIEGQTVIASGGELVKIPLRQIHSFKALEDVTIVVFRVHEEGQPERIMVE